MKKHFEEDAVNFNKIDEANKLQEEDHKNFYLMLGQIQTDQQKTKAFMENLAGVSDLVKGAGLLKKPMIWLLAVVVGFIALMGGLKTIVSWFFLTKI